jgi:hypothetical protein
VKTSTRWMFRSSSTTRTLVAAMHNPWHRSERPQYTSENR